MADKYAAEMIEVQDARRIAEAVVSDPKFWMEVSTIDVRLGYQARRSFITIRITVAPLPWWRSFSSETAKTDGNETVIRTWWIHKATLPELAATIVHEQIHAPPCSFRHASKYFIDRETDFAYQVEKIALKYAIKYGEKLAMEV